MKLKTNISKRRLRGRYIFFLWSNLSVPQGQFSITDFFYSKYHPIIILHRYMILFYFTDEVTVLTILYHDQNYWIINKQYYIYYTNFQVFSSASKDKSIFFFTMFWIQFEFYFFTKHFCTYSWYGCTISL